MKKTYFSAISITVERAKERTSIKAVKQKKSLISQFAYLLHEYNQNIISMLNFLSLIIS
jgi:hypothetical protein